MMDWDTYATLLNMEQTERAEKGLPPLFGENQEELLAKKKMRWYDKMSEGMRLMKEACAENETGDKCWDCPFASICEKLMDAARAEKIGNDDIALDEYIPAGWGEEEKENEYSE